MIILGIETSCDETALCLLETKGDAGDFECRIRGNIVHSQIELHREFGGVFPMLAKREHIKNLPVLYEQIKKETGIEEKDIDVIAVTQGPGLEPALWTGIAFAGEIGKLHGIPVIPINHMEGHIVAGLLADSLPNTEFTQLKPLNLPALALLISGGHTEIVAVESLGSYKILGRTKDDAVGEAFDKVARLLGLPYPGGPEISRYAEMARQEKNKENIPEGIPFPRPMISSKDLNFSFSGLKTHVLYSLQKKEKKGEKITEIVRQEFSREFEDAVTEVLVKKTEKALEEQEYKTLIIGGGVIANRHIREAFQGLADRHSLPLYLPQNGLSGDNALMIALAGALFDMSASSRAEGAKTKGPSGIAARGNLSLES